MEKKQTKYRLGKQAENLLLMVLPLIILQLFSLLAYIAPLKGSTLLESEQLILETMDAIGRGIVFMLIGVFVFDYIEKK